MAPIALGRLQLEGCLQSQHRTSLHDVWAFGTTALPMARVKSFMLVLHWDGISWKIVPSPRPANSNTRVDMLFGGSVILKVTSGWLATNSEERSPQCNRTVKHLGDGQA